MKKWSRILIGLGCLTLLAVSWLIAINAKSAEAKQFELMEKAAELMSDGIYIRAVPLLEEAIGYKTAHTLDAEEALKTAYIALLDTRGFSLKYADLLSLQMNRTDAVPGVFAEAAMYYLELAKIPVALEILRTGIEKTGDEALVALYEQNRYAFQMNHGAYDYVTAIYHSTIQVQKDGLWGLAASDGRLILPCIYDRISTFDIDRAIVMKDDEVYAVNIDNNRIAKLKADAFTFGNYANDRIPFLIDDRWYRATGEFALGTVSFEEIGMYSGGYAAAKIDGKWGVVNTAYDWLLPAEFDGIISDELGRCHIRGAVFALTNGGVYLYVNGQAVGGPYEDARPFADIGYAAVKNGGKWGFIDIDGTVMIDYSFDDALSFVQHLAAVRQGELWGYINANGAIAIEPQFLEAKSFTDGDAPILTEGGWRFITLHEYKKGVSL
ncbi:MAG: WG repeat-containing protein [Oscillospiraceae bacterium]|nr:WG repeat-containing protein [Oscillospiraceae bacterium]